MMINEKQPQPKYKMFEKVWFKGASDGDYQFILGIYVPLKDAEGGFNYTTVSARTLSDVSLHSTTQLYKEHMLVSETERREHQIADLKSKATALGFDLVKKEAPVVYDR